MADVGVRHHRRDPCLGDQHGPEPRVVREVRQDPLDHKQLLEPCGPLQPREKDLPHPARRKARKQLVTTKASRRSLRSSHGGESLAELCEDLAQLQAPTLGAMPWYLPCAAACARASRACTRRAPTPLAIAW